MIGGTVFRNSVLYEVYMSQWRYETFACAVCGWNYLDLFGDGRYARDGAKSYGHTDSDEYPNPDRYAYRNLHEHAYAHANAQSVLCGDGHRWAGGCCGLYGNGRGKHDYRGTPDRHLAPGVYRLSDGDKALGMQILFYPVAALAIAILLYVLLVGLGKILGSIDL